LRHYLRHERQKLTVDVFKERHPLFSTVSVPVNHVGRATKHHSRVMKAFVLSMDIHDSEIDHRVVQLRTFLHAIEIEAQAFAIKKRQRPKRVEMPEA
jgi:hypothetical protein